MPLYWEHRVLTTELPEKSQNNSFKTKPHTRLRSFQGNSETCLGEQVFVAQLGLTLCDPTDWSPPSSSGYGIHQARIPKWVAIPFSRGSSNPGIKPSSPALQTYSLLSEPLDLTPVTGRSPGEGNGYTLQYSCLESPWTEEPGRPQSLGT